MESMANHPGGRPGDTSGVDPSTSSANNSAAYFIPELHEGNAGLMGLDFQFHQSLLDRPELSSYSDIVTALCQNPGLNSANIGLGSGNMAALANSLATPAASTAFSNFGLSEATLLAAAAQAAVTATTPTPSTISGVPTAANFNFLLTPTTPGFSSTISGSDLTLSPSSDGIGLFTMGLSSTSTLNGGTQPSASLSPPSLTTAGPSPTPFAQPLEGLDMPHPTDTLDPVLLNDILRSPVLESLLPASTSMSTPVTTQVTSADHASPTPGTKRARPEPRDSALSAPKRTKAAKPKKTAVRPLTKRSGKRQVPPSPPLSPPEGSSPVGLSLSPTPIKPQTDQATQQIWQLKPLTPATSRPLNAPVSIASAFDAPSFSANKVPISRLGHVGSTLTTAPAILPLARDPTPADAVPPLTAPPAKNQRRIAHNAIERRYRNNINDRIRELKDSIPALAHLQAERDDDKQTRRSGNAGSLGVKAKLEQSLPKEVDGIAPASKLNKATILRKATEYVWHLRRTNDCLRRKQEAYLGLIRDQAPNLLSLLESIDKQAEREADDLTALLRSQPGMRLEDGPTAVSTDDLVRDPPAEPPTTAPPLAPTRTVGTHVSESSVEALSSTATSSDSDTASASSHDTTTPGSTNTPHRSGASSASSYPLRAMLGASLCISMVSSPFASSSSGGGEDGGYEQRTLSSIPFLHGWHGSATASSLGQWGHAITSSDLFHWVRLFIFVSSLLGLIFFDDWFGDRRQAKKRRYWKTQYGTHATPTETSSAQATPASHTGVLTSGTSQPATAASSTSPGTHGRRDRQRVQVTRTKVGARHATLLTSVAEINNTPLPRSYRSMFMRICGEVFRLVAPQACLPESNAKELSEQWLRLSELQLFHEDVALPGLMKVYAWLRSFSLGSMTPSYSRAQAWLVAGMHLHKSVGIRYIRNQLIRQIWQWAADAHRVNRSAMKAELEPSDSAAATLELQGSRAPADLGTNCRLWQWVLASPAACDYYLSGEWKPFTRYSLYTVEWPRLQLMFTDPTRPLLTFVDLFRLCRLRELLHRYLNHGLGHEELTDLLHSPVAATDNAHAEGTLGQTGPLLFQWYLAVTFTVINHKQQRYGQRDAFLQRALALSQQILRLHASGKTGLAPVERAYVSLTHEAIYLSLLPAILVSEGRHREAMVVADTLATKLAHRQQLEALLLDTGVAAEDSDGEHGALSQVSNTLSQAVDSSLGTVLAQQVRSIGLSSLLVSLCTDSSLARTVNSEVRMTKGSLAADSAQPNVPKPASARAIFAPAARSLPIGGHVLTTRRPGDSRAVRILYQHTRDIERQLEFLVGNLVMDARYECCVANLATLRDAATKEGMADATVTTDTLATADTPKPAHTAAQMPVDALVAADATSNDAHLKSEDHSVALLRHLMYLRQLAASICDTSSVRAYLELYEQMRDDVLQFPSPMADW